MCFSFFLSSRHPCLPFPSKSSWSWVLPVTFNLGVSFVPHSPRFSFMECQSNAFSVSLFSLHCHSQVIPSVACFLHSCLLVRLFTCLLVRLFAYLPATYCCDLLVTDMSSPLLSSLHCAPDLTIHPSTYLPSQLLHSMLACPPRLASLSQLLLSPLCLACLLAQHC